MAKWWALMWRALDAWLVSPFLLIEYSKLLNDLAQELTHLRDEKLRRPVERAH